MLIYCKSSRDGSRNLQVRGGAYNESTQKHIDRNIVRK